MISWSESERLESVGMRHEKIKIQPPGSLNVGWLYTYLWDNSEELYDGRRRPMVVLCPGGAYGLTSDREAEALALKFMTMGCHSAVLRYSVAPARFPEALLQLAESVRLVREKAEQWYVQEEQIVVQGSSAGGHLAASLGVFWNRGFLSERLKCSSEQIRPNRMILSYPVISSGEFAHVGSFQNLLGENWGEQRGKVSLENYVDADTPPTFLWHTDTDETVPADNSLLFVQSLRREKVPVEFHLYGTGVHGMGTAGPLTVDSQGRGVQKECENWMDLAANWLHWQWEF